MGAIAVDDTSTTTMPATTTVTMMDKLHQHLVKLKQLKRDIENFYIKRNLVAMLEKCSIKFMQARR